MNRVTFYFWFTDDDHTDDVGYGFVANIPPQYDEDFFLDSETFLDIVSDMESDFGVHNFSSHPAPG